MQKRNTTKTALKEYGTKRRFRETPEPAPSVDSPSNEQPIFVIQEHHATRLHYDFRLEADGVLKSWAVTKEPSLDPAVKRLAVHVEDHPLAYATFAGTIPAGQYGAGKVLIWDHGTYTVDEPVEKGLRAGHLGFTLHGEKLNGRFALVRMRNQKGKKENWLLIKSRDEYARTSSANDPPAAAVPALATHASPTVVEGSTHEPNVVAVTNPDKVLYPADGFTKADISAYYRTVAPRLLPFLKDRPMTLERLPDGLGAGKPHFWQKNTPVTYPEWIPRVELRTESDKPVRYVLVNDLSALLYLVNQGTLTFHPWLSRVGSLDRPDFVLFDLDPGEATFSDAVKVARRLREELTDPVVKTSGKTGVHVLVRWQEPVGYDAARAWALKVASRVAAEMPDVATVEIRKAKRGPRVYIDVLQNARGHHAVPPYVLRAVPGAPVSTPLQWSELRPDLDPMRFTLRTVPARLARQKRDPMAALLA
jgi:bifunctional non-homologous end joining protein LigD